MPLSQGLRRVKSPFTHNGRSVESANVVFSVSSGGTMDDAPIIPKHQVALAVVVTIVEFALLTDDVFEQFV